MATKKTTKPKKENNAVEPVAKKSAEKSKSGKWVKWVALLLLIIFGFYVLRRVFLVAMVNGQPVTRYEVVQELEKQGGAQVAEQLITRKLIFQAMAKAGVSVSEDEITAEIDKLKGNIEGQGMTFEQALELQGLTEDDLRTNIRVQKGIELLLAEKVMVTDEEVEAYYEENAELFAPDTTLDDVREDIKDQLSSQKLQAEYQAFVDGLREQASIINVLEY